jgi:diadenosine tetraphosphatase ApaH/serine/threonine PP2A family protein phosphatase
LSEEHLEFLKGLPYVRNEYGVTFTHASANMPQNWEYIHTAEESKECMDAADTNVTFIGHVHVPNLFYETPAGELNISEAWEGLSIPLFRQCRYVVNVGSVGQPRDGILAASFVIYDMDARTVTFHRVPYDYNTAARKIIDASLDRSFADRLLAGT